MTIYERPRPDIFASGAPTSEIQPFQAWARGLGIAFDETNGFPEYTGLNGLFNALNTYIKYLEQNGFAEWIDTLEYPVGAGVRVGLSWYRARTKNTNKPPSTSQTDWELFLNASALSYTDPLYIENNVVKIRDASTAQKGAVQFANPQEVTARSNVSKAINPSNVGSTFEQVNGANGWCRLPNGLIMQWGVASVNSDSNLVVALPREFVSACYNAQATLNSVSFDAFADAGCGITWTRTQVTLRNGTAQRTNVSYFAIGI
jgi:hypothetical protein